MVIARRNMMVSGEKLPYKRRLAYLEATGTQWIDAGITGKIIPSTLKFEARAFHNRVYGGSENFFGGRGSGVTACNVFKPGNTLRLDWISSSAGGIATGDIYDKEYDIMIRGNYGVIDGVEYSSATKKSSTRQSFGFYLWNVAGGASSYTKGRGRFYFAKLYLDGVNLDRSFIPVIDNDDVPCFFDEVSEELFYNNGTGNFLYGELGTAFDGGGINV